jgi:transcriptional regulator with XRE-family HTH domain
LVAQRVFLRVEVARARLASLNLTQSSLAVLCELDIRTVQRWFAGRPVGLPEADDLARTLRIGTADLFEHVPDDEGSSLLYLMSLVSRMPFLRDRGATVFVRKTRTLFQEFLAPLVFRRHPLHGYVVPVALPTAARHGFMALRIGAPAGSSALKLVLRLAPAVLDERAVLEVRECEVSMFENHFVRSMRAARRELDGSFELWFWVGDEASEVLVVSTQEVSIDPITLPAELQCTFDMSHPATAHALCVRPTLTQVARAELPRGFDRVTHRDPSRVDMEEADAQPRTTPG